jgi:hypothetical protein
MTESDAAHTLEYLTRLFPKHGWEPEMCALFVGRIRGIQITTEQARAAIGEYRCHQRFHTPDLGRVVLALRNCELRKPLAFNNQQEPTRDPTDPPITGYEIELVHRWRADKADPVFDRLEKRHRKGGTLEGFRDRFRRAMAQVGVA